ncbi:MAG TPA: thioesterase family protein [Blastocatellia bacterium]|nr:thioesterase family protein [Blastocatellia bacterium]
MRATESIPVGASDTRSIVVTREMTVAHFVETMPEVYGTPIMIYHMETVSGEAIHKYLPDGWVTVGVLVNVRHLAATPVGATVTVRAEVVSVNENTITFAVEAHDGVEKIGEGTHVRAAIQLDRFMKRVLSKSGESGESGA